MANKYIVDLTLQRHLSALPKFVPVKSRVCGRQQSGAVVFYALVTLCAKKHVHISVAVGLCHCDMAEAVWGVLAILTQEYFDVGRIVRGIHAYYVACWLRGC